MEAFELVCMNGVACRTDNSLKNAQVAFVRSNQVLATSRRHLLRKLKRATNMVNYCNPAMC